MHIAQDILEEKNKENTYIITKGNLLDQFT
jgi:hypothetical protein